MNFVLLLLVLVSKKGKSELGKKSFMTFPGTALMAEAVLSIPLLLSTCVYGKLNSSANEQSQIQVGKTIASHLAETVKISLSHL